MTSRIQRIEIPKSGQRSARALGYALANVALIVIVACGQMVGPGVPAGAKPFPAPQEYALWWSLTEQCSALQGQLADVHWFVLPGVNHFTVSGRQVDGYWSPNQDAITLAEASVVDGGLVRHEMLHALLGVGGEIHPATYFVSRCGGIVACDTACLRDAGSTSSPPPDAPIVAADSLRLGLEIVPTTVSEQLQGDWFVVIDSVKNPYSYPIWIKAIPFQSIANTSTTFGYSVRGPGVTIDYQWMTRDSLIPFASGEVKRMAYDVGPANGLTIGPGSYTVRGMFSRDTTPPKAVEIRP